MTDAMQEGIAPNRAKRGQPGAPPVLEGGVDRVEPDGTLEGWAWSPQAPHSHRVVAVTVDGHVAGRTVCDRPRPDLAAMGKGTGNHGFLMRLAPGTLRSGVASEIALRDLATGQLVGEAVRVAWGLPAEPGAGVASPLTGNLDRVTRDGWVSGWCWDPAHPTARVTLDVLVDEEVVGSTLAANWRADLQQAGIGDGSHGFSYALPYEVLAQKGTLRVRVQEAGSGRPVSDPVVLRIGRQAEAEQRIAELERHVRLLRGRVDELLREAGERPAAEERAARALFATVAGFFQELADGTDDAVRGFGLGRGLQATFDALLATLPALALDHPSGRPQALVLVPASAAVESVHRCLAALHAAGVDRSADLLVIDPGEADARNALLPGLVRGVRYEHCGAGRLAEACNAALRRSQAPTVAFVDPQVDVTPQWFDELRATLAREPDAAMVGGVVLGAEGLLQHGGFAIESDARLRDLGQFAEADRAERRFLRAVDAVASLACLADRERVLAAGGLEPGYTRLDYAVVGLCARLRADGGSVLLQPSARALWVSGQNVDAARIVPDVTGSDENARQLRLALLASVERAGTDGRGFVGHALVVDDTVPRPDRDAGSVVTLEQMLVLRRLGWRVTFAPANDQAVTPHDRHRLERLGIEAALPPEHPSVTQYLQDFGEDLDLVQVGRHTNATVLEPRVREFAPRAKLLFAPHDLHFLREAREAEVAGRRAETPARKRLRAEEVACVRSADATLVMSDHELKLLAAETEPAKLHLLRWVAQPKSEIPDFASRDGLLFVGNFAHRPNIDAVQWYATAILPVLRRRRPGLVLHVVGSDPPREVATLAGPDIEVHGWVRDLETLLGRVRLSIAPLRYGAGFKGKVAVSLAQGVPVVGTALAMEGTGLEPGDGVAVADTPQAFAAAVVRLHDDATVWETQSRRALERVAALYSPAAAASVYRRMLSGLGLPFRRPSPAHEARSQ
jgi:glycosyltransferase involved in cell wall biosynthesis